MALHSFSPTESPELATCCEIAKPQGYYRFLEWHNERIFGCLIINEHSGRPASVAWEQDVVEGNSSAPEPWASLWKMAVRQLGIEELLGEKNIAGYSLPELQSTTPFRSVQFSGTGSSQIVDDFRGAQVVVTLDAGPKLKLRLSKIDPLKANAIWSSLAAKLTTALGQATQQLLNIRYSGDKTEISERLNRVLPYFDEVHYDLNDNAHDQYYVGMLKPLTLQAGRRRVFPAIQVERDTISQTNATLRVNVVRSSDGCWLEFQSHESIPLFPWLQQTLKSELDIWAGPASGRWGW